MILKTRWYISGPITGMDNLNKDAFYNVEKKILESGKEVSIFNPSNITIENGSWSDYMDVCIYNLIDCEKIIMLKGWDKSKGARIEKTISTALGIKVVYEDDLHLELK